MKSVQIRSYFWSVFSRIQSEYTIHGKCEETHTHGCFFHLAILLLPSTLDESCRANDIKINRLHERDAYE